MSIFGWNGASGRNVQSGVLISRLDVSVVDTSDISSVVSSGCDGSLLSFPALFDSLCKKSENDDRADVSVSSFSFSSSPVCAEDVGEDFLMCVSCDASLRVLRVPDLGVCADAVGGHGIGRVGSPDLDGWNEVVLDCSCLRRSDSDRFKYSVYCSLFPVDDAKVEGVLRDEDGARSFLSSDFSLVIEGFVFF